MVNQPLPHVYWISIQPSREEQLSNFQRVQAIPALARALLRAKPHPKLVPWFRALLTIPEIWKNLREGMQIGVIMKGGRAIGMVQFTREEKKRFRSYFAAVHPDLRGKGLGHVLYAAQEEKVHQMGGGVIQRVLVSPENVARHMNQGKRIAAKKRKTIDARVAKIHLHSHQEHPVAHIHVKPSAVRRAKTRRRKP